MNKNVKLALTILFPVLLAALATPQVSAHIPAPLAQALAVAMAAALRAFQNESAAPAPAAAEPSPAPPVGNSPGGTA